MHLQIPSQKAKLRQFAGKYNLFPTQCSGSITAHWNLWSAWLASSFNPRECHLQVAGFWICFPHFFRQFPSRYIVWLNDSCGASNQMCKIAKLCVNALFRTVQQNLFEGIPASGMCLRRGRWQFATAVLWYVCLWRKRESLQEPESQCWCSWIMWSPAVVFLAVLNSTLGCCWLGCCSGAGFHLLLGENCLFLLK